MNLKEQEYVCELAHCGSITNAAAQLYITQPALSAYIRNVEKSLGVDLFVREGKRLRLTYAGELYVKHAEEMLRLKDDFLKELDDVSKGIQGRYVIGVQKRRSPYLSVQTMLRFAEKYPHIELTFIDADNAPLQKLFQEGKLDLLVHNEIVTNDSVEIDILLNEMILLAVPPSDPLAREAQWLPEISYPWLDLKKLTDRTFILPMPEQSLRADCMRLMNMANLKPKKTIIVGNLETELQLAAEGIGLCFTRESYVSWFNYAKRPSLFSIGTPVASKPLYAIYYQKMEEKTGFLELIDVMRQVVADGITKHLR